MQYLIVRGDPGIRKGAVVNYEGEEYICFNIQRQGDYHGPDEVQLWCTIGTEEEHETFQRRQFVPHWLDVDTIDGEALDVVQAKSELAI